MHTPKTFKEAIESANDLLTKEDEAILRGESLETTKIKLHFTLGHQLRNTLDLWREDAEPLYKELMNHVPGSLLVIDGDSASSALIEALWLERNPLP